MRKLCFNKPLLSALIIAFLLLQWSATHFHLADSHEHDSHQHQHSLTTHQHQLSNHHADAIDMANHAFAHADNNKVVELDHVCNNNHGKIAKLFALAPSAAWKQFTLYYGYRTVAPIDQQDSYQTYHQYTSIRLRAPPVIS